MSDETRYECPGCGHWLDRHEACGGCTIVAGTLDGLGDAPCLCTNPRVDTAEQRVLLQVRERLIDGFALMPREVREMVGQLGWDVLDLIDPAIFAPERSS